MRRNSMQLFLLKLKRSGSIASIWETNRNMIVKVELNQASWESFCRSSSKHFCPNWPEPKLKLYDISFGEQPKLLLCFCISTRIKNYKAQRFCQLIFNNIGVRQVIKKSPLLPALGNCLVAALDNICWTTTITTVSCAHGCSALTSCHQFSSAHSLTSCTHSTVVLMPVGVIFHRPSSFFLLLFPSVILLLLLPFLSSPQIVCNHLLAVFTSAHWPSHWLQLPSCLLQWGF